MKLFKQDKRRLEEFGVSYSEMDSYGDFKVFLMVENFKVKKLFEFVTFVEKELNLALVFVENNVIVFRENKTLTYESISGHVLKQIEEQTRSGGLLNAKNN